MRLMGSKSATLPPRSLQDAVNEYIRSGEGNIHRLKIALRIARAFGVKVSV